MVLLRASHRADISDFKLLINRVIWSYWRGNTQLILPSISGHHGWECNISDLFLYNSTSFLLFISQGFKSIDEWFLMPYLSVLSFIPDWCVSVSFNCYESSLMNKFCIFYRIINYLRYPLLRVLVPELRDCKIFTL